MGKKIHEYISLVFLAIFLICRPISYNEMVLNRINSHNIDQNILLLNGGSENPKSRRASFISFCKGFFKKSDVLGNHNH